MAQLDETLVNGQAGHVSDHQVLAQKANYVFDVMDFGAVGDGVTDDSTAIQATIGAAEAATPTGQVYLPPKNYKIDTGLIVLDCDLYCAGEATITVDDAVAVGLTIGSSAQSCDNHNLQLPEIVRESIDWDSGPTINATRGVLVAAADTCVFDIRRIQWFSYGLVLEGDGQGVAYNTIRLGFLENNAINIYMTHINSGWSNQNTFIGGRINIGDIGGSPPYAGTRQILLGESVTPTTGHPNGNLFIGTSIESNNDEYKIECWGSQNRWIGVRFEGSPSPKVAWRDVDATWYAQQNVIDGGYSASGIAITSDSNTIANSVLAPRLSRVEGGAADGHILMSNGSTDLAGLKMFAGGAPIGDKDASTDYTLNLSAALVTAKAEGDTYDRFSLNTALGRLYFGDGTTNPGLNGYLRYAGGFIDITGKVRIEAGAAVHSGNGTPESSVTAVKGSIYMRTDGGAGTSFYVKESGSGDTGWVGK